MINFIFFIIFFVIMFFLEKYFVRYAVKSNPDLFYALYYKDIVYELDRLEDMINNEEDN